MPDNDYSGTVLDDQYRIISLLGRGSVGAVYLGKQIEGGAQVAVKFLRGELTQRQDAIKRFFREARAAAEIGHENIIRVLDVGISTFDEPYMVMEYLEGENLADMLKRVGTVDLNTTCSIVEPILLALSAMHAKGIVHRDIKPAKVFLVQRPKKKPLVKLIDFGLSKFVDGGDQANVTVAGQMLGSLSYISPEQVRKSSNVDLRSDLYSVGTMMYEMLTGRLPFDDAPPNEELLAKLTREPRRPREVFRGFPAAAEPLIMRTLNKEPAMRPKSAIELVDALRKVRQQTQDARRKAAAVPKSASKPSAPVATPAEVIGPLGPLKKAWTGLTGNVYGRIGGIVGVVGLILGTYGLVSSSDADEPTTTDPATQSSEAPPEVTPQTPTPPEAQPSEVKIEVRGIPINAKIYYDNALVPMNPFRVTLKEVIIPLKIEAEGYDTYTTSVVPAEDQVVRVEMVKASAKPAALPDAGQLSASGPSALDGPGPFAPTPDPGVAADKGDREKEKRPRRSRAKRKSKKKGGNILTGKRKTKFREEFD